MTRTAGQHIDQRPTLPPSDARFKHLDSLLIALDEQPRQPRRIALQLRKRWIERAIPAYSASQRQGGR